MAALAADWLLLGGIVHTLDPRRPRAREVAELTAEGLAVSGGRVVACGSARELRPWRGRGTRVIELGGAVVLPGLVDAHAHLDREGLKARYPSLAACRSVADVQGVIRRAAARRPPGEWIVTMPLGVPPFYLEPESTLAERRWPTRAELDAAAPRHPVLVRGIWGYWNRPPVHSVANSLALERAGVGRATVAPPGVEIVRDPAGEPTGLFVERNAIQVLEMTLLAAAPRFTPADRLASIVVGQRRYAASGVTAVVEGHGVAPEVLAAWRACRERGDLRLRVLLAASPTWEGAEAGTRAIPELAAALGGAGLGDERLRFEGLCLHWGGDPDVARLLHAALPYTGWAGFVESANDPVAYRAQAVAAARAGLRVHTLVTRCLPEVLDAWEAADRAAPIRGLRWTLVHVGPASPADLVRARRLGCLATSNPTSYLYRSGDQEAKAAGRVPVAPHRSLARAGIRYGIGTDNKPADPWLAFRSAVERQDMTSGRVHAPEERLTARQALAAFCRGGAWLARAERRRGMLAPGMDADLAVFDVDPLAPGSLAALPGLEARLTMVGGEIVHGPQLGGLAGPQLGGLAGPQLGSLARRA